MQVEQESIKVYWDFPEMSAVFSAFTRAQEDCSAITRVQIDHNSEGFQHNKYELNGRPSARAAIGVES